MAAGSRAAFLTPLNNRIKSHFIGSNIYVNPRKVIGNFSLSSERTRVFSFGRQNNVAAKLIFAHFCIINHNSRRKAALAEKARALVTNLIIRHPSVMNLPGFVWRVRLENMDSVCLNVRPGVDELFSLIFGSCK